MNEPPQKIFRQDICIICSSKDQVTENNDLLTNIVIKQFLTSSRQLRSLCHSKTFDFCVNCCASLEDLLHLQTSLDFILESMKEKNLEEIRQLKISLEFIRNNIKLKKTEIKINILKTHYARNDEDAEEFRKMITRDFRPVVQLYKTDCINVRPSSPLFSEIAYLEGPNLQIKLQPVTNSGQYDNDKIRSEEISVQPNHVLPFLEEETVVKFEPWHDLPFEEKISDSYDEFINLRCDEKVIDSDERDPIPHSAITDSASAAATFLNEKNKKIWNKPQLSYLQLSLLSILTSKNMQLSFEEIISFIIDNFPFYQSNDDVLRRNTEDALSKCTFISVLKDESKATKGVYVVSHGSYYLSNRRRLKEKLNNDLARCMAFPERLHIFKAAVTRKILIIQDVLQNSVQEIERTTNFGETFNYVETEENTVKIEHCVHPIESDDDSTPNMILPNIKPSNSEEVPYNTNQYSMNPNKNISESTELFTNKRSSSNTQDKVWPETALTIKELCILAILNSSRLFVTLSDAQSFITENFPFYANYVPKLHEILNQVLNNLPFTVLQYQKNIENEEISFENFDNYLIKTVYIITDARSPPVLRDKIAKTLKLRGNLQSMAFPDRVPNFIQKLMTNKCNVSDKIPFPKKQRNRTHETMRRKNQRDDFHYLQNLIPYIQSEKQMCSKVAILKQAKIYIGQLENFEKELNTQKLNLQNRNTSLVTKLKFTKLCEESP